MNTQGAGSSIVRWHQLVIHAILNSPSLPVYRHDMIWKQNQPPTSFFKLNTRHTPLITSIISYAREREMLLSLYRILRDLHLTLLKYSRTTVDIRYHTHTSGHAFESLIDYSNTKTESVNDENNGWWRGKHVIEREREGAREKERESFPKHAVQYLATCTSTEKSNRKNRSKGAPLNHLVSCLVTYGTQAAWPPCLWWVPARFESLGGVTKTGIFVLTSYLILRTYSTIVKQQ